MDMLVEVSTVPKDSGATSVLALRLDDLSNSGQIPCYFAVIRCSSARCQMPQSLQAIIDKAVTAKYPSFSMANLGDFPC